MNDELPLWYRLKVEDRLKLWNFQQRVWGLKLEIPSYPVPDDGIDYAKEMQKAPRHPRRVH